MRVSDLQQIFSGLLKNAGKTESIEMTPGQVINAVIKSVKGNLATISYRGMDLIAQLEIDIPAGEQLKFLVAGEKEGQIILKPLTGSGYIAAGSEALLEAAGQLGLSSHSSNEQLIREMIKRELPLTPDAAEKLSAFIRNGNIAEKDIWLPVYMFSRGIGLTTENYQKMTGLLTDMDYLQADLQQLAAEVSRLAAVEPESEGGLLARRIGDLLSAFKLEIADGQEVITGKLESLFRMLTGTRAKSEADQVNNRAIPASTETLGDSIINLQTAKGNTRTGVNLNNNTNNAGTLMGNTNTAGILTGNTNTAEALRGDTNTAEILRGNTKAAEALTGDINSADSLKGNVSKADPLRGNTSPFPINRGSTDKGDLGYDAKTTTRHIAVISDTYEAGGPEKHDLVDLLHRLASKLAGESESGHRDLAALAGRMAQRLEFLQSFNNQTEINRENLIIVHSCIGYDDNSEPLRMVVKYRRDGKENKKDFSSCKIEVMLHTQGLGPVKCEIGVNHKDLAIQFITENDAAGRLLDSLGTTLTSRLEVMDYRAVIRPYKLQVRGLKEVLPDTGNDITGLFRINMQV